MNKIIYYIILLITFSCIPCSAQFVSDEKFDKIKNSSIADVIINQNEILAITDSCTFIKYDKELNEVKKMTHECSWTALYKFQNKILYKENEKINDAESDIPFISMKKQIPDFWYSWRLFQLSEDLILEYDDINRTTNYFSLSQKKSIKIPLDSGYSISNIAMINSDYYYICKKKITDYYTLKVKVYNSSDLKFKYEVTEAGLDFSMHIEYYIDGSRIYLLIKDKLLLIDNKKVLQTYSLENFNSSISKRNFVVINNKVYIPTEEGLYINDLETGKVKIEVPENFSKSCLFGFDKIISWNDYLILLYGNSEIFGCKYNKYTMEFYKVK